MGNKCRVVITGGLGNQLFKFANAIRLANLFDIELTLDTSFYDFVAKNDNYATPRILELHNFPNLKNFEFETKDFSLLNRTYSKLMRISPRVIRKWNGYFTESDDLKHFKSIKVIEGSFENLSCLPDHELLKDLLKFSENKSEWLTKTANHISNAKPLSLHVRLTDFTKNPQLYNVVERDYYIRSVETFKRMYPNQPLWLFSDDPVAAQLFLGPEFVFERVLDPIETKTSVELMELLSHSFGICAANSTFSWWAAFLGTINNTCNFVSIPKKFNTLPSDLPEKKLKLDNWHIF